MFNGLIKKSEDKKEFFSIKIIIGAIILAIAVLFFSGRSPDKNEETEAVEKTEEKTDAELALETEKRLEEILEKIDGAGDVSVMIYYSSTGEKVVASNTKIRSEKTENGEGVLDSSEDRENSTVLYGGSEEKPFVTEERLPKPGGIIVIAEGAKNEKVKYEIAEAVKALLGLAPNRISVVAKAQGEI